MKKIDFNDPKVLRHWEERIARFEGLDIDPKKGKEKYIRTKSGLKYNWPQKIPSYHASLTDLFRVIEKIADERKWGTEITHFVADHGTGWTASIGPDCGPLCDRPEKAIFTAICQYLRQYYPTVGEEQEEIERNAE